MGTCGLLTMRGGAFAQQSRRVARIGWLGLTAANGGPSASVPLEGLRAGLRERGWVEGDNLVIEARSGGFDNAHELTTELVRSKVDLIVAEGGMIFRARASAGGTPMIFVVNGDPVEANLVSSYARPGGTLTGMTNLSAELSGKRVELLKDALPSMTRLAAIANQGHPGWQVESNATRAAAKRLGLDLAWLPVYTAKGFEAALEAVERGAAHGLVAVPDNLILSQAAKIAGFSSKLRIPAISGSAEFAEAGNLMSYGPVLRDVYVKMAGYADRMLRGAKPDDLPVENPTRFELVINLKVARALRLTVSQAVLLRADRIID
jgi:putative ABC transport system substrate-binding protein